MHVSFTFCSLVVMAEGGLLKAHMVKEEFSATRKKNLKSLVPQNSFFLLSRNCANNKKTSDNLQKTCLGFKELCL